MQVYFDTYKEVSYPLEPDIIADKVIPDEGYIQESTYSSVSNVTVSGPTTEVNKVSKVVARFSFQAAYQYDYAGGKDHADW